MTRSAAAVEQQLGESAQRIEILDTSVAELNQKLDRLDKRVNTIVATSQMNTQTIEAALKALDAKIDRLEAPMRSFLASLQQNQTHVESGGPSQIHSQIQQPIQVPIPNLERNRENPELGYRLVDRNEEIRKGLYKKMEMPTFAGQNPFDWIARAERNFRVTQSSEEYKMELVSLSLSEDALCWFNYELEFRPFRDWTEFKRRLLSRFAESFERTPGKRLFGIQQHGSAAAYIKEFQELASQVRVAEENLIDIFFNGLKQELKEVIKMKEPKTLPDHIETILKMEDSEFCRLLAAGKSQEQRGGRYSSNSTNKTSATYIAPWKPKQTTVDSGQKQVEKQGQPKVNEKNNNPIKLSDTEYDYKRRNGLCFKCPEKWSKTHLCKNKTLQVMVVCQDMDMELIEEEFHKAYDGGEVTEIMELSLQSFLGQSSPTTTKINGRNAKIGVVVLIDSGATHNFISPDVVKRAHLQPVSQHNFTVLVGIWLQVQGSQVCNKVPLQLQGMQITTDFIVLEPGSADIVLGVQWLRTLGKCEVDWDKQELSFLTKTGRVTLQGDVEIPNSINNNNAEATGIEWDGNEISLFSFAEQQEDSVLVAVRLLLDEYKRVFEEPTELPPVRGFEHAIRLCVGTKPISVRPYRYPHTQMEIIEKMVQQMLEAGLIRNSRSPYSSPVLLVKKKDGGCRFCVDYRAVNKATIPDKFPIPIIDQLLDELNGAVIFSKLDLRSGYHQIRMDEADIEKTAFRTHEGQYEFVVMPFGLSNAPATFQALMNNIFKPFLRKFVLVFFDDILVYSRSVEEHVEHLKEVMEKFVEWNLFANHKKCLFGQS